MAAIELVYGIVENPAAALAQLRAGGAARPHLGPASAVIAEGAAPLRLNTHGWASLPPEAVQGLSGTEALTAWCRERLRNRTTAFALVTRSFLAAYLDFAAAEIERRREELEARLRAIGLPLDQGFPTYRDWIFSALLPLPHAVVRTGDDAFVEIDVLFWTGRTALALALGGRTMPTPRTLRARNRLAETYPQIRFAAMESPADGRSWAFGPDFLDLLDGELFPAAGLPFGPYRVLGGAAKPNGING